MSLTTQEKLQAIAEITRLLNALKDSEKDVGYPAMCLERTSNNIGEYKDEVINRFKDQG